MSETRKVTVLELERFIEEGSRHVELLPDGRAIIGERNSQPHSRGQPLPSTMAEILAEQLAQSRRMPRERSRHLDRLEPKKKADDPGSQVLFELQETLENRNAEIARLKSLINNPEIASFLEGVQRESAHQIERWGEAHDRSKSVENWYWLVGYLAGKALRAAITGDKEKALHHTISAASALAQWHAAINADESGSGIGVDADLAKNATP